jgi:hypothetical protein
MARGVPRQWVRAKVKEPIAIGKSGARLIIWDKWGKTRRGTLVVTVGGVRWYRYKAKKPTRFFPWAELDG